MKLLWVPCWDDCVGGEAYNIILEKESSDFNKTKYLLTLTLTNLHSIQFRLKMEFYR